MQRGGEGTAERSRGILRFVRPEVMVLAALLSVLGVLVVPRYSQASERARVDTVRRELELTRGRIEHFRQREGRFPSSLVDGRGWADLIEARYLLHAPANPFHPDIDSVIAGPPLAPGDPAPPDAAWYIDREHRLLHAVGPDGRLLDL